MAITLQSLKAHAKHVLGGNPDAALDVVTPNDVEVVKRDIVNQAGRRLYSMHDWSFRERPPVFLAFTQISVTGATWTESTRTLTKTGGFTNLSFYAGVKIDITAGTGATAGEYVIESKTSNDAIVLVESIGSGADGQTDIAGTITPAYCELPDDFGGIESVEISSGSSLYTVRQTSPKNLQRARATSIIFETGYLAAVVQPAQAAQTSALPAPQLHIWPAPTAADADALVLNYFATWPNLTDDAHIAAVPSHVEDLLIALVRLYAEGYEESDEAAIHDRIIALKRSPLFTDAVDEDGGSQNDFGTLTNGAARRGGFYQPWTSVQNPS